jgi:dTDP-4-dehydrorhamnose reductase
MKTVRAPLELWGGVECTVNRIGDRYFDQIRRSGHHDRPDDLDRFAALGLRAIRYPVLWERVAPDGLAHADWTWSDARLLGLRERGIRPIAGLLHHGSGPRSTGLLDPDFPEKFAAYAAAIAGRYPWIRDYTPINEPLTTARFSALYGYWYPHARDDRAFTTALLNQIVATVLAMREIRRVNPGAQLVQTEDAGRTYSSPTLTHQARFENQRRWLTFDLLTGRVDALHPLRSWLEHTGGSAATLDWLCEHPCPPAVVGLNYYLTSDRYLDHRFDCYAPCTRGGNGREAYADVEAVRACLSGIAGHQRVLEDAWHRYRLPVAITEAHAGCTREDQVRWLAEAWSGAEAARAAGTNVRAVTAWALLGGFDWNSLLMRDDGVYEPGAFDVRSDPPRVTAVGALARSLAMGGTAPPFSEERGWWRRPERLTHAPPGVRTVVSRRLRSPDYTPLVITGARGTLGSALVQACRARGLEHVALGRRDADITSAAGLDAVARLRPWAVINAAGYVRVDDGEGQTDACLRLNVEGPVKLAATCAAVGARFVTFSTDLVFDGYQRRPYVESDRPAPLNVYGVSKLEAEQRVLGMTPQALVIRTSAFFGPTDRHNFLTLALDAIANGQPYAAAHDAVVSPTYVPELADVTLDLLLDGERGIWHVTNRGHASWYEFALAGAAAARLDPGLVSAVPMAQLGYRATRPAFSALTSARGILLSPLDAAIDRYVRESGWLTRVGCKAARVPR